MNILTWLAAPKRRLDIVAGLVDGILNALTLAADKLLHQGSASLGLAVKVGAATASTTVFVFFVAHYADLRSQLVRSERELNLLSHGHLATTQLGQQILLESISGALVASCCGLLGSGIPLLLAFFLPGPPVLGIITSIGCLGLLGALLARSFFGSPLIWALGIMASGTILTLIGIKLDIVG